LADLLAQRVIREYYDFIRREWIEEKESAAEEGKGVEKKGE
jgi:hypothetical protein